MSKLGTILQARTLPQQANGLFSNCSPALPDMFKVLGKSWQNSGVHPVVESFESLAPCEKPVERPATDDKDCPWLTRLADEWQVGIEALAPLTWQSAPPAKTFTRPIATTDGTNEKKSPAMIELETGVSALVSEKPVQAAPTNYLTGKLLEAIQSGASSTVQQVLQLVGRQPQSSMAALLELRESLVKGSSTPLTVDWENGTDSNGKPFVRLCFTLKNDWSKGSGSTKLVIGSDNTTYATFVERWNSTPLYLSPDEALEKLQGNHRIRVRDFHKTQRTPQNTNSDFAVPRVSRHFRAAV